ISRPTPTGSSTRPEHHQADADQGDQGADHVGPIGPVAVNRPAPEKRQDDEKAPVHGIDPTEVALLEGRDDAVEHQDESTSQAPPAGATIPEPLPDEPPAADLADPG